MTGKSDGDDEYSPAMLERMSGMIRDFVPHNRSLGLEVVKIRNREVWVRLPYRDELVGNPETGVLHGGAVSSMMDAASGLAVMSRLGRPGSIATLDLRIDYLKPAPPSRDVIAHTNCFKVTKHVCFVRGVAYVDDENDPIASVSATFARKA
jgi:uncharacterized protein (TIGR00369 family)